MKKSLVATAFVLLIVVPALPAQEKSRFKSAPTTDELLRQEAAAAPLSMAFRGKTSKELETWQAEFRAKLKSLLGPYDPPKKWETIVEEREDLDAYTREKLVLVADGHPK